MKNNSCISEEIDDLLNKKLSVCDCNPCTCSEQTKDKYFRELKDVLTRFNKETLGLDSGGVHFINNVNQNISS